jgi:hypothetical protein
MSKRSYNKQARAMKQVADLMAAAPLVMAQRMSRMAASGADPSPSDALEAQRMVQEKLDASAESMMGVAMTAMRLQAQAASLWMRPWWVSGTHSRNSISALATFAQSAGAELSHSAVAPFLRKTRANAKRLSR